VARDPFEEPIFGDVFQFVTPEMDYPYTVFLRGAPTNWHGLDLYPTDTGHMETPRVTDFDMLRPDDWRFVEHIDGFEPTGWVVTPWRGASEAEVIAALEAKGYTNIKVIGKSAIQYDEP
jgi:hypothetical protein